MAPRAIESHRADVLVIGGGAAGALAAIIARQHGHDVLLADRSYFGRSGCSALASGMFSYYKPEDPWDYWLSNHGGIMVNRARLKEAIRLQYDLVHWLESWGVRWVKEGGEVARMGGPGIPFPHSAMMEGGGPQFMMALRTHALRIGVRVLDRALVTDLLTSDGELPTAGRVVGAMAMHTRTGQMHCLHAAATVLAAGPMHFPYPKPDEPFTGMPIELSGDGIALSLRVGAELSKMEIGGDGLVQGLFHAAQGFEMLLGLGGSFVNGAGEDFLARFRETAGAGTHSRRSSLGNAGTAEMVRGTGPVLRVNRDLSPHDVRLLDVVLPIIMRTFESAGIRTDRDLVPYVKALVGSTAVSGAGLRINERAESSIPGLYGAGNATDGAYVIMGQNLSTCAVMGVWAGNSVGECIAGAPETRVDAGQVERLAAEAHAPIEREAGLSYQEVHDEIGRLMLDNGHVLSEPRLAHLLGEVGRIRRERLPRLHARDWHDLAKVHGLANFCTALEATYRVMRHRCESRGNVFRADYPYTDNVDWLCTTVARFDGERLSLRDVPRPETEDYAEVARERVPHPFFELVNAESLVAVPSDGGEG